ncbi:MAG TPA: MoaD/ThiS family protein [Dehalococcoidia bacterium]|nr:MoaD/ThiS family protein [Dehalococcoidia bacterium]
MDVNVRLFAGLHQMVGKREITLDVPDGATVRDLRERLGSVYPVTEAFLPTLVCAVGEEYVPSDYVLREGDMVALIPPVSGG